MDEDLLHTAREAGARLLEAEHEVGLAQLEYHQAIRRLHLAGASLREIAAALGLSHQRVHQIVDRAGGARPWRSHRTTSPPLCSFCGRPRREVAHCIAGPGVYICDRCVAEARAGVLKVTAVAGQRCSFCWRRDAKVGPLAEAHDTRICSRCLDFCDEIIQEARA